MHPLLNTLTARDGAGRQRGLYSVCSAHPWVIEAAMRQAQEDGTPLLIEATCNQVNQFGGYTGMQPADFVRFVHGIAAQAGFDAGRLVFGGDHLGPNPWRDKPASEAMALAADLLRAYAAAGFVKLHLDASMACADDPPALSDATVAARAAALCEAAEAVAPGAAAYVVGTEVPVPGGATEALSQVEVTSPHAAQRTLDAHRAAFVERSLQAAWARVIALVVQPGVEFDHTRVIDYQPDKAVALSSFQRAQSQFVFEAHSTDYQRGDLLARLVEDGFAILKVGPGLTFALREALYLLELIEQELLPTAAQSHLRQVVEAEMLRQPRDWAPYYHGSADEQAALRVFSYSDRVRYYWGQPSIAAAVQRLVDNLQGVGIPQNLLSQYMPAQYDAVRRGAIDLNVRELILDRVRGAIRPYASAC